MYTITANQLRNKGISAIAEDSQALITVRGYPRYVIIDINHYHVLRELELAAALEETKRDYKKGDYVKETVKQHIKRVNRKRNSVS